VPSPLQLPDDPVISYVIPLVLTSRGDSGDWRLEEIAGTGFLVAEGRGLGVTARHIAHNLERGTAAAVFAQADGTWRAVQILKFEQHPVEDVALFRLPADDYYSPFSVVASQHYSSAEYSVWGYPEDEHHDRMAAGGLAPDLVYSAGHIRRRVSYELPSVAPGRSFYELSTPAGHKCSGAPVSELTNPWHVIGVYVGERRNDTGTLAVGYATRTEALHAHWPALFGTAKLSTLCVAGRA
jgi:Trypsin-like peptidase domain